jgi:internalin A
VRPIESQRHLRDLNLNAYFKTPVDFSVFTELQRLHLDWGPGAESIAAATQLEDLSINRYPGTDLALFRELARLRRLRLASGRRLTSLRGIEAFRRLEELRLLDLRVLSDLDPIVGVSETLRSLEFNTCRKIDRLDALRPLRNLTRLHVLNCGDIESLAPVLGLPLEALLFYESTNIRDGDLGVLLKLPELTDTSFANRRHYSNTREEIQARLSAKG